MSPSEGRALAPAPADLRLPALAVAAWAGTLAALVDPRLAALLVAAAAALGAGWLAAARHRRRARPDLARRWAREPARSPLLPSLLAALAVLAVAALVAAVHVAATSDGPVAELAADGAVVEVTGTLVGDPRLVHGPYGDRVAVRLRTATVAGRGRLLAVRVPLVLLGPPSWTQAALGAQVRVSGRLRPADDAEVAGLLAVSADPDVRAPPGPAWRAAETVRAGIRGAVAARPADQRALVPALVDGDDGGVDPAVAEEFRVTGLTHLLAVSGTNLTLVVGALLWVARGVRVRGRGLVVVGSVGVVGFVLLARTEPSVVRAAAMGTVGLIALGTPTGPGRAGRALSLGVLVLLLLDPTLATSPGFALSVLATAGIVWLAPAWRDAAVSRGAPAWLAEAVAVPLAAQLACTPIVAALSGQVSLVAPLANLVVAPVVGPATVLGLLGGLMHLLWPAAGALLGAAAGTCVAWVLLVAHLGAGLPGAAMTWGSGPVALTALTVLSVLVALLGPALLRARAGRARPRRWIGRLLIGLGTVVGLAGGWWWLARPGPWPPPGWVLVACDVGQGDALALRTGPAEAVVVDAGPDPAAVDRCLDDLGVTRVPLVVLTHFHADHVDGLPGVLEGRAVDGVLTTPLRDPPGGAAQVDAQAAGAGVPVAVAAFGATAELGETRLQVLWPPPEQPVVGPGDGSTANEASVVLLAQVRGLRLLLTGDVEPEGQGRLAALWPGLQVDLLKVPHHGSRYQDLDWLTGLGAAQALVSVGAGNDYGHPADETLTGLRRAGIEVWRTDLGGDLAVVADGPGQLHVESRG